MRRPDRPQIDQRPVLVMEEEHPLEIRLGRRPRVPAVRRHKLIIRQELNRHGPQEYGFVHHAR